MKKILLPVLMMLSAAAAFADPPDEDVHRPVIPSRGQLYAQFDLGFNFTSLNGNDVVRGRTPLIDGPTNIYQSASGLAPLFSASIGYEFNRTFGLLLRADVDMRGASNSGTTIDTCFVQDGIGGVILTPVDVDRDYSLDVTYLSLSALAKLRFDQFFVFAGPTISAPLSRNFTETNAVADAESVCTYFPSTTDSSKVITGSATGSDNTRQRLSFKLGVGYIIPLTSKMSLVPQIGYDFGFTNVLQDPELNRLARPGATAETSSSLPTVLNPKMRLSSLQATIGLRINL